MKRERAFYVAEGVLLATALLTGYRACTLDRSGDPERAFGPILATIALAIILIGCMVGHRLSVRRSAQHPPAAQSNADSLDVAAAAGTVSAISGALAWIPLFPLAGPVVCAAVAIIVGLLAVRSMTGQPNRERDRRLAVAGAIAGAAYVVMRTALVVWR